MPRTTNLRHGRCADCDTSITALDVAAMRDLNAEYSAYVNDVPYPDLDAEESLHDLHCADCLDYRAERAQARRDADFYGGSSPTLAELSEAARRLK